MVFRVFFQRSLISLRTLAPTQTLPLFLLAAVYVLKSRATSVVNGRAFAVKTESVFAKQKNIGNKLVWIKWPNTNIRKGQKDKLISHQSECVC